MINPRNMMLISPDLMNMLSGEHGIRNSPSASLAAQNTFDSSIMSITSGSGREANHYDGSVNLYQIISSN
jgi:hypothetical protein